MTEIEKLLEMNYESVCNYLKNKYGNVTKDYFTNDTYKSKTQGIKRAKEGLYFIILKIKQLCFLLLHDLNYHLLLTKKTSRLVYCNLLEHLVLHIKIFQYPNPNKNPNMNVGVLWNL